jgi:anti-sigma factor RsiW
MTTTTTLDDYTMAAFISGTLPEDERRAVLSTLLHDDDARQWLHMACEALAASKEEAEPVSGSWLYVTPRPPVRGADRPASRYVPYPRGFS